MSNIRVHDHHSLGTVPFSWENKPGVCKETHQNNPTDRGHFPVKLPPPPCPLPETPRASFHDLQVPLPPCAFQPPSRSSSKKGFRKQDDPFLTAYKECTKSTRKGKIKDDVGGFIGLRKNMSIFSCKTSCSVMDIDSVIRISELPHKVKLQRRKER